MVTWSLSERAFFLADLEHIMVFEGCDVSILIAPIQLRPGVSFLPLKGRSKHSRRELEQ